MAGVEGKRPEKKGRYKTQLTELERFWTLVRKTRGCWYWIGYTLPKGYGLFRVNSPRRKVLAHRYSYTVNNGPIPRGKLVLHECDNPTCIRPDHLFTGTHQDNVDDMIKKGRHQHGDRHYKRRPPAANRKHTRRGV